MVKENNGLNKINIMLIILMFSFFGLMGKFIFSAYNISNILSVVNNITFSSQELLRNSLIISNSPNNTDMRNVIKNKDDLDSSLINLKLGKMVNGVDETKLFMSDIDFSKLNNLLNISSNIVNNATFIIDKKTNLIKYKESVENYTSSFKEVLANIQIFANSQTLTNQDFRTFLVEMYGNINNDSIIKLPNNNFQEINFLNKKINTFNYLKSIYQSLLKYNKENYFNDQTSYSLYKKLLYSTNQLVQNGQTIINFLPDVITVNDFSSNNNTLYENLNDNYQKLTKMYNDDLQNQKIYFYFSLLFGIVFAVAFVVSLFDKTPQNSQAERNYKRYKRGVEEITSMLTNISTDNLLFQDFRNNKKVFKPKNPIAKDLLNQIIIIFSKFYYENIALNRAAKDALSSINIIKANLKINASKEDKMTETKKLELIKDYNKNFQDIENLLINYKNLEDEALKNKIELTNSKDNMLNSIKNMNTLRLTFQEMIKTLKKLGEISQSIDENIENINMSNSKIQISTFNIAISASDGSNTSYSKKYLESAQDMEKITEQIKELIATLKLNRDELTKYSKDAIKNMEESTTTVIQTAEGIENHKEELKSIIELTNFIKTTLLEDNTSYNNIINKFKKITNEMFLLINNINIENEDNTLLIDKLDSIELQIQEIISKTSDKEL